MSRESYDRWKVKRTQYNTSQAFYVACDCGSLATRKYPHSYFECPNCPKKYALQNGQYVQIQL